MARGRCHAGVRIGTLGTFVLLATSLIGACSAPPEPLESALENALEGARYACSGEEHMCVADYAWDAWLTDAPPSLVLERYLLVPGATRDDESTVSWSDGARWASALDPSVTPGYADECGLDATALHGKTMILLARDLRAE